MSPPRTRFVLIETSHAGNVGAVARAMKVMGFDDLVLVAPRKLAEPPQLTSPGGSFFFAAPSASEPPHAMAKTPKPVGTTSSRRKAEKHISIREADNGWIVNVSSYGSFGVDDKTHVATSLDGALDYVRQECGPKTKS